MQAMYVYSYRFMSLSLGPGLAKLFSPSEASPFTDFGVTVWSSALCIKSCISTYSYVLLIIYLQWIKRCGVFL